MSRRSAAIALDVVALALVVLVVAVLWAGGFALRFGDLRISFRTPSRTLVWLAAAVAVRVAIARRTGPLGLSSSSWRRMLLVPAGGESFDARTPPGFARRLAAASLGVALALAIVVHDQLLQPYSVPDYGDPLFSIWRMEWVLHQLVADPARLFDANIFYPERLTLTLSDPIILPALTAAPLRALGVHPVLAYNIVLLSGFWLSGVATYLLVERLTGSARAAFVAGVVYACYPYRFDHYSHLELQMTQWMPLGLLALHAFVATERWPCAVAAALAAVAQLYSSLYYGVFFIIYAVVIGIGLILVHRPALLRFALSVIAAVLIAGLIAVPVARAFIAAAPARGERPVDEIAHYSAVPSDYLRVNRYDVVWRERLSSWVPERSLFPGAAPLALAIVGLAPPFSAMRVVYAGGLFVAVDGSLGFNGVLYPLLHRAFAPLRSLRVPARFGALVGLTLSIFAGFGARRLFRRSRSEARARVLLVALTAAVVVEAYPALQLTPVWKEPPRIYEQVRGRPGVVLAEFPVIENEVFNLPFMYFSLWHWTPMVNGYSGYIPQSYRRLAPDLLAFPRGDTPDALRRRGVTHVTVNCRVGGSTCAETEQLMRQSSRLRLTAETQWEGSSVALFELAD